MRDTPRAERVTATDDDDDVKRSSVYEDEDSGLIGTGQRQQRSYERQQQSYRRRTIGCWVVAALLLVSVGLNLFMAGGSGGSELSSQQQTSFSVSYTAAAAAASDDSAAAALDGRVYLLLSSLAAPEPRFQVREVAATTVHIIGQDVDGMAAAKSVSITTTNGAQGYPARTLEDVAPGRYYAQAVLVTYETFHLATGQTVKLPSPDRGDGMHWTRAPGNLYSTPVEVTVTANGGEQEGQESYELVMDHVMPEIPNQGIGEDTEYVKHLRVVSPLLSAFWGREMWLGAIVLLPHGFDEHPEARYPIFVNHGHYPGDLILQTEPPAPDLDPDSRGYLRAREGYDFYQKWTQQSDYPRHLILQIQHPTPYYDDSYAVNSASMGPWGDAIMQELLPAVERQFRGIGEGWARFTYGGSTGGWEALAVQIMYPDDFNGCFAACPDSISFEAYATMNIYEDSNAYWYDRQDEVNPQALMRPETRNYLGALSDTVAQANWLELALGTHGRSAGQWDIWAAVYGPQGEDGYPDPIWDKDTGVIDQEVAEYWRENYDLTHILDRDWRRLWPKLRGKLHVFVGDMDTYYLNNAVYLFEEMLQEHGASASLSEYEISYGDRAEHCWNGDHENINNAGNPPSPASYRYNTMYMDRILARIEESAPPGADTTSWRYTT